jgi:hypothetical protein
VDTFELHQNFITPAEQTEIIAWAALIKEDCVERLNLHGGGPGRRMSKSVASFNPLPDLLRKLDNRMAAALNLTDAIRLKYKVVIHEQFSNTENHVDAYSNQYPNFFRAALLVQEATQGGIFRVDNIPVTFPELSLLSFVGASSHGVTTIAQGERILLRANWYKN